MKRFLIIRGDIVENIVAAEKSADLGTVAGALIMEDPGGVGVGDTYANDKFTRKQVARPVLSGAELAEAIKAECQRRIFSVIDASAQQRLQNKYARGKLTTAEIATFEAGDDWIDAMVTKCRTLVAAADQTFREDRHWPNPSADIPALAAKF